MTNSNRRVVAMYDYADEKGHLLYQSCRTDPKDFFARRPDGKGGYVNNLRGVQRVLYGLPGILRADTSEPVYVVEGEKDADRLIAAGKIATTNVGGAGKWREEYNEPLRGRHVRIIPDDDGPGHKHAEQVAAAVYPVAASVKVIKLEGVPDKGDVSDWLDAGHTVDELNQLADQTPEWRPEGENASDSESVEPIPFSDVEDTFNKWLLIRDPGYVRTLIGAVIANRLEGDPFWLFVVAASGGTKTEPLRSLTGIHYVYPLSDLTEQTFISGDRKSDKASLLLRLPKEAILMLKDFTTVLSMHPDKKGAILSQLREIYDGYYKKDFGTGQTVEWNGKMGLIAGVTAIVDRHHGVYQMLGERFLQYRPVQPNRVEAARRAMKNNGHEKAMRSELQRVVQQYVAGIPLPAELPVPPEEYAYRYALLADLCAVARSGVVRDSKQTREIELIPDPELPTRISKQLKTIATAFAVMSGEVFREEDYVLVWKIAMDSIPKLRRRILNILYNIPERVDTTAIATALGYPAGTTRRSLEDLTGLRLAVRHSQGQGLPDQWEMTPGTKKLLNNVLPAKTIMDAHMQTVPDKSGDEVVGVPEEEGNGTWHFPQHSDDPGVDPCGHGAWVPSQSDGSLFICTRCGNTWQQ